MFREMRFQFMVSRMSTFDLKRNVFLSVLFSRATSIYALASSTDLTQLLCLVASGSQSLICSLYNKLHQSFWNLSKRLQTLGVFQLNSKTISIAQTWLQFITSKSIGMTGPMLNPRSSSRKLCRTGWGRKSKQSWNEFKKLGIIFQVSAAEFSTNPIVPVLKPNGQVRICGDFKITVNRYFNLTQ